MLPFQRESVCKGKAFFLSLQTFSKFFSKKFGGTTSRGLSVSRSLASLQGKILGCSAFSKSASLYQSVIFSGSPSRKRLQRYALFPVLQLLRNTFLRKFWRIFVNRCKQDGCMWAFFDAFKNGRKQPYIMISRGRAGVCTRTCVHVQTNRKKHAHIKELRLRTEKNRLMNRSRREETTETR